eukprot:241976-Chlamydomonas_euryale.AAC.3
MWRLPTARPRCGTQTCASSSCDLAAEDMEVIASGKASDSNTVRAVRETVYIWMDGWMDECVCVRVSTGMPGVPRLPSRVDMRV